MIKLYNDDCLLALQDIPENSIDLVIADLPYGTTQNKWDIVIPFDPLWTQLKRVGKFNTAYIFTATQPFTTALINSNPEWFRYELIWQKPNATNPFQAKTRPMRVHENILVFYYRRGVYNPQMRTGKPYKWNSTRTKGDSANIRQTKETPIDNTGTRYPISVLQVAQDRGIHSTQKPVELMEYLIRTYSNIGDTVLDPTMGSGTTGIAALNLDRSFIGIEKDEHWFQVAQQRIINGAGIL